MLVVGRQNEHAMFGRETPGGRYLGASVPQE
jgi:hypothetical protein